jgi:hypothetical protein
VCWVVVAFVLLLKTQKELCAVATQRLLTVMPPMPPNQVSKEETFSEAIATDLITAKTPGYSHDEVLARYLQQVPENMDLTAPRSEHLFVLPTFVRNFFEARLKDKRDWICLELILNVLLVVVPLWWVIWSLPLWAPEGYAWTISIVAPVAFLLAVVPPLSFYQRYLLTLHVTSHNKLFPKGPWAFLNHFHELFINPFFGVPPGSYYLHHVIMHHRENNVFPRDMSSTMPYQRDSLSGLLSYCLRYWTHQCLYLGYYALKTGRIGTFIWYSVSWVAFIGIVVGLGSVNPIGTFWMVIVHSMFVGLLLMQGNFAQHMYIDPKRRFDNFGLAFNYVNHFCNQRTYNDGYHIIHHMNSKLHWSKVPQWFMDNIERFAVKESIIFNGIDTLEAWFFTVTGNWKSLHSAWVDLSPGPKRDVEYFRKMIQDRLIPLDGDPENFK